MAVQRWNMLAMPIRMLVKIIPITTETVAILGPSMNMIRLLQVLTHTIRIISTREDTALTFMFLLRIMSHSNPRRPAIPSTMMGQLVVRLHPTTASVATGMGVEPMNNRLRPKPRTNSSHRANILSLNLTLALTNIRKITT